MGKTEKCVCRFKGAAEQRGMHTAQNREPRNLAAVNGSTRSFADPRNPDSAWLAGREQNLTKRVLTFSVSRSTVLKVEKKGNRVG